MALLKKLIIAMSSVKFLFITANPEIASYVIGLGVDKILVDLEILGKVERQGHLSTVISRHDFEDISVLRPLLPKGTLQVRLNPVNNNTEQEIEEAISRGADMLMLPMFRAADEVRQFCKMVNFRAKVCLLVETIGAMENIAECIKVPGVDQVHIGLNDLHLEMGCRFMFEPLSSGHVDYMAKALRSANMPFGIGGVARLGEGLLPAEMILSEHARLGSTWAILSRTFHREANNVQEIQTQMNFADELQKLRTAYQASCKKTKQELKLEHLSIKTVIENIASKVPNRTRRSLNGI